LNNLIDCHSLEEVRTHIDRIDRNIVTLIAERGVYVKQASRFKKNTTEVKAPARVEQVIAKVSQLSTELGADTSIIEAVYRVMIAGFIHAELAEQASLNQA
jgi:isochorismate pyruvate lyase